MRAVLCAGVGALVAAVLASAAFAGTPLTESAYVAKLRAANAASTNAQAAAILAVQSNKTTTAQVKQKFMAMGATHVRIGHEFAALTPPNAAAKANADFAHAEIVLGQQTEAAARKIPAAKAKILKYLQSLKSPSGGRLLERAIAELHKAGFDAQPPPGPVHH